jgi:endonuclease/exonuclease/phosphatase family metal-dependent hydrolase
MSKLTCILTVAAGLIIPGQFSNLAAQSTNATNGLPLKIRVGTYNVGHFNQGKLGGYQESDPKQAAERWRAWIKKQSLDVFFVNEWDVYFDKAGTMDATELLLKPSYENVFFGKKNKWIYNGIATNFKISNVRQVDLTLKAYYATLADWQVGNVVITLMSVHVPWQECCHETSIDALIEELKKHKHVICGGDLNATDRNVLKIKAAGFNVANGGNEGWFCTAATRCGTTTVDVNIDNIITSRNINISKVAAPTTGLNDLDHLPIMADLTVTPTSQ